MRSSPLVVMGWTTSPPMPSRAVTSSKRARTLSERKRDGCVQPWESSCPRGRWWYRDVNK